MDQKLNVTITASEGALVNALNGATQAVNSSTATWAQKLGDTKTQVENAAASIDNLTAGLQQAGANAALPSEDIDRMNAAAAAAATAMQGMVEKARELQEGASQYNTTVEGFQAIQVAAASTNAEMSDIKAAMDGMDASLMKLNTDVPETKDAFDKLGVTFDDLKSLSPEERMVATGSSPDSASPMRRLTAWGLTLRNATASCLVRTPTTISERVNPLCEGDSGWNGRCSLKIWKNATYSYIQRAIN